MFFSSWESLGRGFLLAACVYFALLGALRIAGSRSLAKMSAYDMVVTIALGSLIATIPLSRDTTLADGFVVIATYLVLQRVLSWMLTRWRGARVAVKEAPMLLLWEGRLLDDRLRNKNVTEAEVRAAVRSAGKSSYRDVLAVVLENDGSWSVVPSGDEGDRSALRDLDIPGEEPSER